MRILHTTHSVSRLAGGTFFSVRPLCQELAKLGHDVPVLGTRDQYTDEDAHLWAPATPLSYRAVGVRQFGFSFGLRRRMLHAEEDLLHTHGAWQYASVCALEWKSKVRKPHIYSPHGMLQPWAKRNHWWRKAPVWWTWEHRNLRSADVLQATSQQEAKSLRGLGCTQPIALVPHGIQLPQKTEIPVAPGPARTALFLSRISPLKGLINLVHAWKAVAPEGWRMVICGPDDRNHLQEVKDAVDEAGLQTQFEFRGAAYGKEKAELFRQAELFVLPSYTENFCHAIAEALAFGIPAITTEGVPWEELATNHCGWWVKVGVPELAAALREATSLNPRVLKEMGARGRKLIESKPGWGQVAVTMLEVYEWMLGRTPRPECILMHR